MRKYMHTKTLEFFCSVHTPLQESMLIQSLSLARDHTDTHTVAVKN